LQLGHLSGIEQSVQVSEIQFFLTNRFHPQRGQLVERDNATNGKMTKPERQKIRKGIWVLNLSNTVAIAKPPIKKYADAKSMLRSR
jgi:hypothetical protein